MNTIADYITTVIGTPTTADGETVITIAAALMFLFFAYQGGFLLCKLFGLK